MSILFLPLTAAGIVLLAFTAFAGLSKVRQRNQARVSVLVRRNELEARLAERPIATLSAIASNIDEWVARLAAGSRDDPDDLEAHLAVCHALNNAAMPQLKKYRPECIKLVAELSDQLTMQILTTRLSNRKNFWFGVVTEAANPQPSAS